MTLFVQVMNSVNKDKKFGVIVWFLIKIIFPKDYKNLFKKNKL